MNGSQTHAIADQLDFQISLLRLVTAAHIEWEGGPRRQDPEPEKTRSADSKRREG